MTAFEVHLSSLVNAIVFGVALAVMAYVVLSPVTRMSPKPRRRSARQGDVPRFSIGELIVFAVQFQIVFASACLVLSDDVPFILLIYWIPLPLLWWYFGVAMLQWGCITHARDRLWFLGLLLPAAYVLWPMLLFSAGGFVMSLYLFVEPPPGFHGRQHIGVLLGVGCAVLAVASTVALFVVIPRACRGIANRADCDSATPDVPGGGLGDPLD